jgi:hypothetical protein
MHSQQKFALINTSMSSASGQAGLRSALTRPRYGTWTMSRFRESRIRGVGNALVLPIGEPLRLSKHTVASSQRRPCQRMISGD